MDGLIDPLLTFSLKIDWDAEKAIEAMKKASKDSDIFKSELTVYYSSLQEKVVDLRVSCTVNPAKKDEAKSLLLKATYLARHSGYESN